MQQTRTQRRGAGKDRTQFRLTHWEAAGRWPPSTLLFRPLHAGLQCQQNPGWPGHFHSTQLSQPCADTQSEVWWRVATRNAISHKTPMLNSSVFIGPERYRTKLVLKKKKKMLKNYLQWVDWLLCVTFFFDGKRRGSRFTSSQTG